MVVTSSNTTNIYLLDLSKSYNKSIITPNASGINLSIGKDQNSLNYKTISYKVWNLQYTQPGFLKPIYAKRSFWDM
jgi:hypothetical protein